MTRQLIFGASLITAAIVSANAQAFEFGKPIQTPVLVTKHGAQVGFKAPQKKEVTLMNIKLTPSESNSFFSYSEKKKSKSTNSRLPSAINLGMNNVPVLDQGYHGSCVTFAITGAVDAVLGKGDYVSPLCSLELGSYLENKGYMPSGWNGSFGPWVIDQMMRFGIVSKKNQETKSCAGVTEYPLMQFNNEGSPMPLGEFKRISEDLGEKLYPVYIMNSFQRFQARFSDTDEADRVLTKVKEALMHGNRLTFGTLLVLSPYCSAGACANHNAPQDTWALTSEIETPPFGTGGHEMVIMGYDDKAVAVDEEGRRHEGLLKIRNSWGDDVGDSGDYYMTYDYFKKFVMEVQEMVELRK